MSKIMKNKKVSVGNRGGTVVGHAVMFNGNTPLVVRLDDGFWSEESDLFVKHILVHEDNIGEEARTPEYPNE